MALPVQLQLRYWGVAAALFLAALWFLGPMLLPFVAGGALAYFLDPLADRLEKAGLGRAGATIAISALMLLMLALLALAIVPLLINQLTALFIAAPQIAGRLQGFLLDHFPSLAVEGSPIRQSIANIGTAVQTQGVALVETLIGSALSLLNGVLFLVVVPVVAFYLLLDWDHLIARIDRLLPRDHAPVIRRLAREADQVLAAFVRGQISVCLALGTFYAAALMLAGLQFGLIVGAIAGAISFIPYVGSLVGGALALGLAFYQFWGDWLQIGLIGAIFALGQFLEGNFITPRLVGRSVGLHPVWLIFALSAFGAVFGFIGLLVAVPVAAVVGVLIRFGLGHYEASRLYQGRVGRPPRSPKGRAK